MFANKSLDQLSDILLNMFNQKLENKNLKSTNKNVLINDLQRFTNIRPNNNNFLVTKKKRNILNKETKLIDKLIQNNTSQPVLEKQLQNLVSHLGFNANSILDRKKLETLRQFFDLKSFTLLTNGIIYFFFFIN